MNNYKLGRTSIEKQKIFIDMTVLYEEQNWTLEDIAKKYNVSKQAVNQFLVKRGFFPKKEKDLKYKRYKEYYKDSLLEEKLKQIEARHESKRQMLMLARAENKKLKQCLKEIKQLLEDTLDIGKASDKDCPPEHWLFGG